MKQVIIVRESLKMPKGKLAVQVAHAAVLGFYTSSNRNHWLESGMPKIVLKASDKVFNTINKKLRKFNKNEFLPGDFIVDAGKTCFRKPTTTCMFIGPDNNNKIDSFLEEFNLKLL